MQPWAIGVFEGATPICLSPAIPQAILTAECVTDFVAGFVADPFAIAVDGNWYLFFEAFDVVHGRGVIAFAEGEDPTDLRYRGVVLREKFHLSYPMVFEDGGDMYMVPETLGAGEVRVYVADPFPDRWRLWRVLIPQRLADPTLFKDRGIWWLFGCPRPRQNDALSIHWADRLEGPWTAHPASPVVDGDASRARPGGRVVRADERVYRFAQDCDGSYGRNVIALEVRELTPTAYAESWGRLDPFADRGSAGWNAVGMHHIDAHLRPDGRWIAFTDGRAK